MSQSPAEVVDLFGIEKYPTTVLEGGGWDERVKNSFNRSFN